MSLNEKNYFKGRVALYQNIYMNKFLSYILIQDTKIKFFHQIIAMFILKTIPSKDKHRDNSLLQADKVQRISFLTVFFYARMLCNLVNGKQHFGGNFSPN